MAIHATRRPGRPPFLGPTLLLVVLIVAVVVVMVMGWAGAPPPTSSSASLLPPDAVLPPPADGGSCLAPATDRSHYSLSAITRPNFSIELSIATAVRPALCASGWLTEQSNTTAVVVDVGVNAGYDLAAWFRLFGREQPQRPATRGSGSGDQNPADGARCLSGGVGNFLFVEPQREKYEAAITAAVDAETARRARAGLPRLDKVSLSFDALGSDEHRAPSKTGAAEEEVNLIGEGEIAIAAIEGSRGLHLLLAAQRAHHHHHQHKRRRAATSNASSSNAPAAPAPWALQGRRGRKARLMSLPRLLGERFISAADDDNDRDATTVDRIRIPFLKIDTEGADATILTTLASHNVFKRRRVGAVVFELNRFAAIFTVGPTHALAMLTSGAASEGYECFLVGMAAATNHQQQLLLTAIRVDQYGRRDWGPFDTLWRKSAEPHVVLALAPSVAAALRTTKTRDPEATRRGVSQECFDAARSIVVDVTAPTSTTRPSGRDNNEAARSEDPVAAVLG